MEFIFFVVFVTLVYFIYHFLKEKKKVINSTSGIEAYRKLYKDQRTENDQIKMSFFVLAMKYGCDPTEIKDVYMKELRSMSFNKNELVEAELKWKENKNVESIAFNIPPQHTPSALLEKWTGEYRNLHFN